MAMAPEQMGIGIRRYFTEAGTHPYDTLEWECRDARIPNYRDGTDAFFQADVEFPVSWSQNATNIVAQKYFRGTLGTPERESSLRQVIDRIADTITDWGIRDGYFVDDDEAETFRDELKYVLVHQRAAFNSPVWFNIGVRGVPQQGSACQPYHALVSTPDGLVPIGKLVDDGAIGAKVFDANGLTKIVAVKHNGRKEVLRIHTKAGITLDVTADHLVWRPSDQRYGRFVEAGSLRPGDQLEWHREESWGTGEISTKEFAEAALAGWLQSDGFVGQYQGTNRSLTIEPMTVTESEYRWVTWALDEVLPDVHRHERSVETEDTSLDCRRIRLYGQKLRPFVERWGLRARDVEMEVPAELFEAPLPVVAAYLRSIFQAEGYVSKRKTSTAVQFDMVSERLVRGVQLLLMRFGIYSRMRFKADRRSDRKGCWSLSIQVAGDRIRFCDEIGFLDPRKADELEASFDMPGRPDNTTKRLEIDRIEALGEMDVYDIQTESGEYLSNHLRVHNCFILAVDDTMDAILNWYREEGIIFKGGSGSGINLSRLRSSTEGLQGGGTASGPVSFMRGADASAGTIKSGGKTRRAAKMVILNADHPDIEEFIWCKAIEERKARALGEAGFDMDLDGKDSHSIQYQNANNSVRVTDEFMQAVLEDRDWQLKAVTTGEVTRTVKARELMRQISEATWECADPGMQFDTTINRWHTAPNTGRINASNPCCFVGGTLASTSDGVHRLEALHKAAEAGNVLPAAQSFDLASRKFVTRRIRRVWIAGHTRQLLDVTTDRGLRLRCTPEHRFLIDGSEFVEARELSPGAALRGVGDDGNPVDDHVAVVSEVDLDDEVPVYDLEIEGTHNFAVSSDGAVDHSVVVHNSEYMHLDNSACNLASINLLKYLDDGDEFDVEAFEHTVEVVFTAQEILVGNADYPTEKIAEMSRAFRQLGLGYANLGALLMARGLPYDSPEGRAWAGAITSLMTGHAYATSARTAGRMGPFSGYADNADAMLNVLRMHREEAAKIDDALVPNDLLSAARQAWDDATSLGERHGVRNSQASVLAPTGTIALALDCDTTGIEPDLALTKAKKLVGGGTMLIVNQTVPRALRRLGYSDEQVDQIVAYINEHKSIVGAPGFNPEHLPVFACSMGDNTIHYMGHVTMMGAVQPFISGAISKTCNVPEETTVDELEQVHIDAWHLGLKAIAIYRDNCKVAQPLATQKKETKSETVTVSDSDGEQLVREVERVVEHVITVKEPVRQKLPKKRISKTFSFRVADCHGYVTVGEFEDGRPGEVFLKVAKQGSTLAGIMDGFAIAVSLGLQFGVPLRTFVEKFTNVRFEPAGMTDDRELRFATSLLDYIFRRLAVEYLPVDERREIGVLTVDERVQPTLPGVEEASTESHPGLDTLPVEDQAPEVAQPTEAASTMSSTIEGETVICHICGDIMQRAGSCYACPSCGTTSGCS
jgi:ribonucleotide reductase alpha subunit